MKDQVTRREFLQTGTAAVGTGISLSGSRSEKLPSSGLRYEEEVPDTLDLADRAALAVNALTGAAAPDHNYETYIGGHLDQRPPYMSLRWNGPCDPKPIQALPMMRVMSGSRLNADVDLKMMENVLRDMDDHGLWWIRMEGRPFRSETWKVDQVWTMSQARLVGALLDWYSYDHDSRWLHLAERAANGLARIALRNGDRAWYYTAFTQKGWQGDVSPSGQLTGAGSQKIAPTEPVKGSVYDNGNALYGLARWYAVSGDKKTLELAGQVARFLTKPSIWAPREGPTMVASADRAHWEGHFHSATRGMMGLLEYAIVAKDEHLQRFVAHFYEYGRNFGIARIGFFPSVTGPLDEILQASKQWGPGRVDEGCSIADMIWLAARMSESGVGDYWDDVDQYVRNQLVEHQVIRRDLVEEILAASPEHRFDPRMETQEHVIERNMGAFLSCGDPTILYGWWTMCCNANCPGGMYKAWESIIQRNDDGVQVNLLLNRASPWMDVDSYLPYEGKIVLKNKSARKAYVRLSHWIDKNAVRCQLNNKDVTPGRLDNYLIFERLAPKDRITIEFPVVETTEEYTARTYNQKYTCRFKGNTLVDISPRAERPSWTSMASDDGSNFAVNKGYPLYLRDSYKGNRAPLKKMQRYTSPVII